MNNQFWEEFYKENKKRKPSGFAKFCLPFIRGDLVDLGCGNGRDLYYFINNKINAVGVDIAFGNHFIKKQNVENYIKENESPDYVYTRFFMHAIEKDLQEKIINWAKNYLFIEARTKEDKPLDLFGKHKRNPIYIPALILKLKKTGFQIKYLSEGRGFSLYKGENPHLVRIIACKNI